MICFFCPRIAAPAFSFVDEAKIGAGRLALKHPKSAMSMGSAYASVTGNKTMKDTIKLAKTALERNEKQAETKLAQRAERIKQITDDQLAHQIDALNKKARNPSISQTYRKKAIAKADELRDVLNIRIQQSAEKEKKTERKTRVGRALQQKIERLRQKPKVEEGVNIHKKLLKEMRRDTGFLLNRDEIDVSEREERNRARRMASLPLNRLSTPMKRTVQRGRELGHIGMLIQPFDEKKSTMPIVKSLPQNVIAKGMNIIRQNLKYAPESKGTPDQPRQLFSPMQMTPTHGGIQHVEPPNLEEYSTILKAMTAGSPTKVNLLDKATQERIKWIQETILPKYLDDELLQQTRQWFRDQITAQKKAKR